MAAPTPSTERWKLPLPPAVASSLRRAGTSLGLPLGSLVFALIIGAIVVFVTGGDPFRAYQDLLCGGFGGGCPTGIFPFYQFSTTIVKAIPLIFTGIAVALAFKAGLFNIGAEGQLIAGAIATTLVGARFATLPSILLIPMVLVAGALAGAVWGGIAGVLKAVTGAHEVVTTIMLNYVAVFLVRYLIVGGPFQLKGGFSRSPAIGTNAQLPRLVPASSTFLGLPGSVYQIDISIFFAIAGILVFWFLLKRTTLGYEITAVGQSQRAAKYAGVNVKSTIIVTMLIAGAFAGLAGAIHIAGVQPYLSDSYITDTTGFDAITVALLGLNSPIGVLLAALLIGGLQVGAPVMQSDLINPIDGNLVYVLQALILFAIAANFLRSLHLRLPALGKVPPTQSTVEPGVAALSASDEPRASEEVPARQERAATVDPPGPTEPSSTAHVIDGG
ncbi:MAG TPA: ABC transporter permease [Ktedonobacterales bacterium]|nr:ABC transporter permease [Ktedonobacterales bacterium]